jgi:hypothetical protein
MGQAAFAAVAHFFALAGLVARQAAVRLEVVFAAHHPGLGE